MTPKQLPTKFEDPARAAICFDRGDELFVSAVEARTMERWSSVGVLAVHAAISWADGVLIHARGLRCTSKNHLDVAALLKLHLGDVDGISEAVKQVRKILAEKNRIEYETRVFKKSDAVKILQSLERLQNWVRRYRDEMV